MTCHPRSTSLPHRPAALATALRCALLGLTLAATLPAPALAQTDATALPASDAVRRFDIPAGPLDRALDNFARTAGVNLSYDEALIAGRASGGLSGRHGIAAGLAALLAGSGVEAVAQPGGGYSLRKAPDARSGAMLPAVKVSARGADAATPTNPGDSQPAVGPWKGRTLQDTPYTVTQMTSEQATTTIARDFDQLYKMNPVVQNNAPMTIFGYPSVKIRGFDHSTGIVDGVRLSSYTYGLSTEETERVDVLNGLSGFLYGAGNVGGIANYVLKRPTYESLANIAVGNYGGSQWFGHIDLGNRIDDEGRVAYRFNAAYSDGDTSKDDQQLEKWVASGALDFNLTDNLLLQLQGAHTYWRLDRVDTRFYSSGISYWPDAYDVNKTYTPGWTWNETESDRVGVNVRYDINDAVALRSAWLYKKDRREFVIIYPIYTPTGWTMYAPNATTPYDTISQGAFTYLDVAFATGGIAHKLTLGGSWDTYKEEKHFNNWTSPTTSSGAPYPTPANLTVDQLLDLPAPRYDADYGPRYKASEATNGNVVIGDDIAFTDKLSALVGVNYATLETSAYSNAGVRTSNYEDSALTPTVSLIYKPLTQLTTYVSYMESLESGGIVPNDPTLYNNPGATLDAIISKQYEIGAKYAVSPNLLLTSALFRIEKANSYNEMAANGKTTVNQDGLQVHQGLEVTLAGNLTDALSISAGGTVMDLGIEKATNPALKGKEPIGSSSVLAKLSLEYAIPGIDGASVSAGAYHSGDKYKDSANLQEIDGYTIYDLGAAYRTEIAGKPTTFNVYVSNLTDEDYWSSYWQLGLPRNVAFSIRSEL